MVKKGLFYKMTAKLTINELTETFSFLENWEDRYSYLIDLGQEIPPMDESLKTAQSKVEGCLSQVWMILTVDSQKKLSLLADSDSQIVRGLVAILYIAFHGKPLSEAAQINIPDLFSQLGLHQHLSVNRRNGFFAMFDRIQKFIELNTQ